MTNTTSWWDDPVGGGLTPREFLQENWLHKTDQEIAEILSEQLGRSVSLYTVRSQRQNMRLAKTRSGAPRIFKRSEAARYNDPPTLEVDNLLVLADVHAPHHDADWCSDVVWLAQQLGIKRVLIAGDLLDFSALSSFTPAMLGEDDEAPDVSGEIMAAAEFCDVLLDAFDEVHMILGNHEDRMTRRLAVQTRVTFLRQLLGYRRETRFHLYPYYFALVRAGGQMWRITHPKNSSVIPARVAAQLTVKYGQNVIAAHGHDWGEVTGPAGHYACACGMCADVERMDYVALRDSTRPVMQQGAFLLFEGQPVLLHPQYRRPKDVLKWLKK